MTQNTRHIYEFGRFRLDSSNLLLEKDGEVVWLGPKVVETLLVLIEGNGAVLKNKDLMDRLWPDTNVGEGNLTQNISLLRKALGVDADFIENLPRRGYRFVGDVREVEGELSRATVDDMSGAENDSRPPRSQNDMQSSREDDHSSLERELRAEDHLSKKRLVIRLIWAGTAVVFVILAIWVGWRLRGRFQSSERGPLIVTDIPAETDRYYEAYGGRIAPDGKRIAFLARSKSSSKRSLFVLELAKEDADLIEENVSDFTPFFWSHDGTSLYFVADGSLKRKLIGQDAIQSIAQVDGAPRGTVNQNGVVLLSSKKGIVKVLPGGRISAITSPEDDSVHAAPYFLPDGVTFLFVAISHRPDGALKTLCSARIDARGKFHRIGQIPSRVEWNANHLLYAHDGALYARPWSLQTQLFTGPEVLVRRRVFSRASTSDADFSVARNGRLVVKDAASRSFERIRPGAKAIPISWQGQVVGITVARDRELAVLASILKPGSSTDLWVWDLKENSRRELTSVGTNASPVLDKTGEEVYYAADRKNFASIYRMSIATGAENLVLAEDGAPSPRGLSSDGEKLLYASNRPKNSDLYCINLRTRRVIAIANSPKVMEGETGRFSPDGRQMVYVSDVSGAQQVYFSPFPPNGSPAKPISPPGGWRARWSNDGDKIYYLMGRGLNEYDIRTQEVRELYRADADILHMEPTPSGEFLVVTAPVEPPNRVVSNWQDAVGREK